MKSPLSQDVFDDVQSAAIPENNFYVIKQNDLIQKQKYQLDMKYFGGSLSLLEQKVLLYCLSKINPKEKEFEPIIMNIKSFCEIMGIDTSVSKNYYKIIKDTVTSLSMRVMWLQYNTHETLVRWISYADIERKDGLITIEIDKHMRPYLLQLNRNYTKYPLYNITRMKSKYGIMLYEILKSYINMSICLIFDIEDLKIRLDSINYKNLKDFKARVISPALKDINTYSDIKASVDYIKRGNKVTHIRFILKDLSNPKDEEELGEKYHRYMNGAQGTCAHTSDN